MRTETTGLAGRYAAALFELAEADKKLDDVAGDLSTLGTMIDESEDLQRLVRSPVISRDAQEKAILAVLEKAGLNEITRNFVGVVAENRRLFALRDMIRAYHTVLAEHRGETTARVVSARELSDEQVNKLTDELRRAMGTKVSVETSVDPDLLGGLVVQVGSRMVDSSLRTKLQQLRLAMKGT